MLDIGWPELLLIGGAALIFIGPKDLPRVLKTMGQWVGQIRKLTREFRSAVDDMIREAELDDVSKTVNDATSFNLNKTITETLDPDKQLEKAFGPDWEEDDAVNAKHPSNETVGVKASEKPSADAVQAETENKNETLNKESLQP